jgi:hypothetical protein
MAASGFIYSQQIHYISMFLLIKLHFHAQRIFTYHNNTCTLYKIDSEEKKVLWEYCLQEVYGSELGQ